MSEPSNEKPSASVMDFYIHYGAAMLCWQHVEHSLYRLFFFFFSAPGINQQTAAVYYSQESFGAKLRIVDAVAKVTLSAVRLEQWKRLSRDLKQGAAERNVLAHHAAVADFGPDNAMGLALAPPIFVPMELRRTRSKKYDAIECESLTTQFEELAKRVDSFAVDVHGGDDRSGCSPTKT